MTISEVSTEDRRRAFHKLIISDTLSHLWQRLRSLIPKILSGHQTMADHSLLSKDQIELMDMIEGWML
jgi:hypothetical protein